MRRVLFLQFLFILTLPLFAQNQPVYAGLNSDEQLSLVGMMMADILERFGPPRSVICERGAEPWQDDVVFQYNGADFYIYRDRVWQVKLASTHGISNGDKKSAVLLAMGSNAEEKEDHALLAINGKSWSLMLRVNFNNAGQVTAIYIYRPDF